MARYFFHLRDGYDCPDPEGIELANLAEARILALHNARFTAGQTMMDEGHFIGDHRIEIADKDGNLLDTVYFRDAVKIEG